MKWFLYLFLAVSCLSCQCDQACKYYRTEEKNWYSDNKKLKVLSTTAMINDLVHSIGGDYIDTLTLIRGELDPHTYQMVKGDDEKFQSAEVIFYNGLGLEHGPSVQKQLTESKKAFALGDAILKDHPEQILYYNGQVDPHIWMDVSLWSEAIPYIVEILSKKDPEHAVDYKINGDRLANEMKQAHQAIKEKIQLIPENKRYLVTSHDAFNYFARVYLATDNERKDNQWQKRFAAPEGLAPESQLSAADIKLIIDHMRKYNIEVIFPESNVSHDSIRKIVQAGNEYGLNLRISTVYLYGDAMGPPDSETDSYLKMVQHNAEALNGEL